MSQPIPEAIAELYRVSGVPQPIPTQRVVPLSELLGGYNLTCTEISGLTSETASNFLLRRGAILEPLSQASKEPLAGYIYVSSISGHIFIERDDFVVRRRFSVAHELGHYVLHFYPLINRSSLKDEHELIEITEALAPFSAEEESEDLPVGQVHLPQQAELASLLPSYAEMEREANQFAAELLMPAEIVHSLMKRYASDCRGDDLVWRLSTEMLVSRAAMRRRLRDLHLLTLSTAQWN